MLHHQLRQGLLGARFLHARGLSGHTSPHFTLSTSLATPGTPRCSDIASYTEDSSVLGHRQLCWELLGARKSLATPGTPRCSDITSYAEDSTVLGHRQLHQDFLDARTSSATPGFPQCSDIASYAGDSSVLGSCYVSLVCYQTAPCCSDQGADLG